MKLRGKFILAANLLLFYTITSNAVTEVELQVDLDCVPRSVDNSDFANNCFDGVTEALYGRQYECIRFVPDTSLQKQDNKTCRFNYDAMHFIDKKFTSALPDGLTVKDISWSCKLRSLDRICDGESECLTDECDCGEDSDSDVFYCVDGSGCISWSKLCDDIQDCTDGSDECFCFGHLVVFSPEVKQRACFSEMYFCSNYEMVTSSFNETPYVLKDVDCGDQVYKANPIVYCLETDEVIEGYHNQFQNGPIELLPEYCLANCSHVDGFDDGWGKYCKNILSGLTFHLYNFVCNTTDISEIYALEQLCDGKTDCSNGADEFGCPLPDRFHCNPNITAEWVHIDKVCDSVKDCSNGADECGTCEFEALSSSEFLIKSRVIVAVTSIMGIVIILLNLKEGYKCYKTSCASKIKAIDRIFLLQIFLYDVLMGVYLCSIVLASIVLKVKGDYCILEQDWRASPFCSALGVVFSVSSHGSLLAIAAVSITRFLTCHSFLTEISKRAVIMTSILGACLNLLHSILPLLPIDVLQDTFRTAIFFKNLNENPFFNSNPVNVSRLTHIYNEIFNQEGNHEIQKMSKKLSNITTKGEIFDFSEIGYYGNTGLCVHNIFKDHKDHFLYRAYKILYCTVLLVLLIIVSIAYIKIVLKQRSSAQATNSHAAGSTSTALTLKVALMIGSQLACWIPLIIAVWYFQYLSKNPASPMVFEAFALVVMPINSFLNPVFYSERYKKVVRIVNAKRKALGSLLLSNFRQEKSSGAGNNVSGGKYPSRMQLAETQSCTQFTEAQSRDQSNNLSTEAHPSNQSTEAHPSNQSPEAHPSNQSPEAHPSNQSPEAHPSNQSPEAHPSNQSTEAHPSNQSTEAHPSNQSTEAHPSNQSTEAHPSNQSPEAHPSNQSPEAHPSNQSPEAHPSNQSTEAHPSNQSTEAHPNNQSTEAHPSNQSTEPHPSNQSTEAQPSNQSTEVHPSNQSTEAHPNNQSTEAQPSNQSTEVHPSNQSTEAHPSNQSTEAQPSNQSTEAHPSNQSPEAHPSNQSTEVHPSNQSTEAHPNNQSTEAHPSNQSTEAHPNNQSAEVHPSDQSTVAESTNVNQSSTSNPSNQCTEAHPSNQSTEDQPSNKYTEAHPSDQSTEDQPSNKCTEAHPSNQSTEAQHGTQSFEAHPSNQSLSTETQPSNQSTEAVF